jgi:ribosomal protein S30
MLIHHIHNIIFSILDLKLFIHLDGCTSMKHAHSSYIQQHNTSSIIITSSITHMLGQSSNQKKFMPQVLLYTPNIFFSLNKLGKVRTNKPNPKITTHQTTRERYHRNNQNEYQMSVCLGVPRVHPKLPNFGQ